jgi:hypothetical protein
MAYTNSGPLTSVYFRLIEIVDKMLTKDNSLRQPGGLGAVGRVLRVCVAWGFLALAADKQRHFPQRCLGAGTRLGVTVTEERKLL